VCYEDILENPAREVDRLRTFVGHQNSTWHIKKAVDFVGPELRRNHATRELLDHHPAIHPLVKEVYAGICHMMASLKQGSNQGLEDLTRLLSQESRFTEAFRSGGLASTLAPSGRP
jgi:hypothetical protein